MTEKPSGLRSLHYILISFAAVYFRFLVLCYAQATIDIPCAFPIFLKNLIFSVADPADICYDKLVNM